MSRGFAAVPLIIAVLVVGAFLLFSRSPQSSLNNVIDHESGSEKIAAEWPVLWGAPDNRTKCQKNENVKFSSLPISIEDILYIEPIGELREGHIIPGDHGGIDYKTSPSSTPVKVYSPADGYLVGVEKHPYDPPPGYPKNIQHYHVYLEHSCTLFTGFVHLTEFSAELLSLSPELKTLSEDKSGQFNNIAPRIPLKAGQQLGTAWSFGLLGWVTVDLTHTNKGYLNPGSYKGENWRIHSVAFHDFLDDQLKKQIASKNPRTKEPLGGKIDYDIEGKAVGNWFEQGTEGLRDEKVAPKQCGNFPCPYWDGHLSLVYDYVDPEQLRVSIGHDWGLTGRTPFGVNGNVPDFKDIDTSDGVVKYELVSLKDVSKAIGYDAESALITENDEAQVLGTMLVQMQESQKISKACCSAMKMEIFPDKSKDQVSGFTSKALIYER
ncbi:hypothetical protein HYW44_02910 [Candidatus Daviesbacteria bacterium]|nr:hypothetical protein [Candidatus Daviesbacteria bacterium]